MKRTVPVLIAAGLAISACGGGSADPAVSEASPAATSSTAAAASGASAPGGGTTATPTTAGGSTAARTVVPAVAVTDIATGQSVELRAQVAPDKPTLLWMWAPH
jgi:hypothetical protein